MDVELWATVTIKPPRATLTLTNSIYILKTPRASTVVETDSYFFSVETDLGTKSML